jgi:uncharacterized SAM-binding protein YcdF (DUF218 family)
MPKLHHSTTATPVTSSRPQLRASRRLLVLSLLVIAFCIATWLGGGLLLRVAAQSWMISDSLGPADAVAVFGGSLETRPFAAAEYYRKGLVKRVLVANNSSLHTAANRSVLLRLGVPDMDIDVFGSGPSNTYEEALALRAWAVATGASAVIVPTEAVPSRRVHWVLQRVFAGTGILVLVPVHYSSEEAGVEWWKNEKLPVTFRIELLKYAYYRLRY